MSKELLVEHVENSIKAHKAQQKKLLFLKNGVDIKRNEMRLGDEEFAFYQWMEGEGAYLKEHITGSTINDIQLLHKERFEYHEKICNIFYDSGSRAWFSNKNSPQRLEMKEQSRVDINYEELLEVNSLLLHKLEILLQRVSNSRMIDDSDIIETTKLVV